MNVLITAGHPTQRIDNTPGTAVTWRLLMKLHADPPSAFTPVGADRAVTGASDTGNVNSLPDGDYDFGVIWLDSDERESAMAVTELNTTVPTLAPLKPGTVVAALA
ncbi:MAG TPA: hypothetical protein VE907_06395 [Gammaproteobacteria bacterium]|nr:hypothetical protein [Gammaproteobacteria bacterium]